MRKIWSLNIKDFEFIKKNLYSYFSEMSAFGVELMTVSITGCIKFRQNPGETSDGVYLLSLVSDRSVQLY